jgi:hypothetical protein
MGQNRPQVAIVAADWATVAKRNYVMGLHANAGRSGGGRSAF